MAPRSYSPHRPGTPEVHEPAGWLGPRTLDLARPKSKAWLPLRPQLLWPPPPPLLLPQLPPPLLQLHAPGPQVDAPLPFAPSPGAPRPRRSSSRGAVGLLLRLRSASAAPGLGASRAPPLAPARVTSGADGARGSRSQFGAAAAAAREWERGGGRLLLSLSLENLGLNAASAATATAVVAAAAAAAADATGFPSRVLLLPRPPSYSPAFPPPPPPSPPSTASSEPLRVLPGLLFSLSCFCPFREVPRVELPLLPPSLLPLPLFPPTRLFLSDAFPPLPLFLSTPSLFLLLFPYPLSSP